MLHICRGAQGAISASPEPAVASSPSVPAGHATAASSPNGQSRTLAARMAACSPPPPSPLTASSFGAESSSATASADGRGPPAAHQYLASRIAAVQDLGAASPLVETLPREAATDGQDSPWGGASRETDTPSMPSRLFGGGLAAVLSQRALSRRASPSGSSALRAVNRSEGANLSGSPANLSTLRASNSSTMVGYPLAPSGSSIGPVKGLHSTSALGAGKPIGAPTPFDEYLDTEYASSGSPKGPRTVGPPYPSTADRAAPSSEMASYYDTRCAAPGRNGTRRPAVETITGPVVTIDSRKARGMVVGKAPLMTVRSPIGASYTASRGAALLPGLTAERVTSAAAPGTLPQSAQADAHSEATSVAAAAPQALQADAHEEAASAAASAPLPKPYPVKSLLMRRVGSGAAYVASWAAKNGKPTPGATSSHTSAANTGLPAGQDPHVAGLSRPAGKAAGSGGVGHIPVAAHADQLGVGGLADNTANGTGLAPVGVQEKSGDVYEGVTVITLDDGTLFFKF